MFYQNPNFSQQHLSVIHEVVPLDERLCHSSSAAVDLVKVSFPNEYCIVYFTSVEISDSTSGITTGKMGEPGPPVRFRPLLNVLLI